MMDRKAPRHSRLSHSATPYARPPRQSALSNGDTPQTPMRGHEESHAQTPGSIFSKVISMFTPSRWNSPRHQQHSDGELHTSDTQSTVPEKSTGGQSNKGGSDEQGAEADVSANTPTRYLPFLFSPAKSQPPNTPAWSLEPLDLTPTQVPIAPSEEQTASPNQMLAKFFREKGDAPLSSIEVQGVMALMQQAQQKQLEERRQSTPSLHSFNTQTSPSKTVTEQLYPSVPSFVTPARHRSATPSLRAPRYNPILTPQPRRAVTPTVTKPKTVVQYPTISTPFKSRTTTPQPSSGKRLKTDSDVPVAEKPERKQLRPASPAPQHDMSTTPSTTPKRISQTASALLSLIEPVGTPSEIAKARAEDRERLTDPAIKSFVNPYAASTPLASTTTRRKQARKESLVGVGSARKKRRALDEIERTIPTEEKVGAFASGIASATPVKPSTHAIAAQSAPKVSTPSARPEGDSRIAVSSGPSSASKQMPSAISLIEKFKPSKSSHLRESIIMNAPESPVSDTNSVEKKSVPPDEPRLAPRAGATSKILFPFGSSDDSTAAKEQEKGDTFAFSPAVSQRATKPDEKNIPFGFDGTSAAPRIATPVPATDISTKSSESEKKALSTNDYMAYLPRFFFSGPASIEVSIGNDDVKQKARDAPEKAFQDYRFRFTFPDVSASS
ncbi:hypothetical protein V1522DRAFT_418360 [Lipomyces starkeyi]